MVSTWISGRTRFHFTSILYLCDKSEQHLVNRKMFVYEALAYFECKVTRNPQGGTAMRYYSRRTSLVQECWCVQFIQHSMQVIVWNFRATPQRSQSGCMLFSWCGAQHTASSSQLISCVHVSWKSLLSVPQSSLPTVDPFMARCRWFQLPMHSMQTNHHLTCLSRRIGGVFPAFFASSCSSRACWGVTGIFGALPMAFCRTVRGVISEGLWSSKHDRLFASIAAASISYLSAGPVAKTWQVAGTKYCFAIRSDLPKYLHE